MGSAKAATVRTLCSVFVLPLFATAPHRSGPAVGCCCCCVPSCGRHVSLNPKPTRGMAMASKQALWQTENLTQANQAITLMKTVVSVLCGCIQPK